MGREIDMIGKCFGRLVVVDRSSRRYSGRGRDTFWICRCDCGETTDPIVGYSLRLGQTKSCGCLRKEQAAINIRKARPCANTQ